MGDLEGRGAEEHPDLFNPVQPNQGQLHRTRPLLSCNAREREALLDRVGQHRHGVQQDPAHGDRRDVNALTGVYDADVRNRSIACTGASSPCISGLMAL